MRRVSPLLRLLHWTSLDAVVVLVAYQWALGRWVGSDLPAAAHFFLASGIWLAYTADRLLDLAGAPELVHASPRHAFLARHRVAMTRVWLAVASGTSVLAPFLLPSRHLAAGAVFVVLATLYVAFASGAVGRRVQERSAPKSIAAVSLLTLAGAWWFLGAPGEFETVGGWVMVVFAGAAWWNLRVLGRTPRAGSVVRTLSGAPGPKTAGGRRDRIALVADGTVLAVMLVVGALAP